MTRNLANWIKAFNAYIEGVEVPQTFATLTAMWLIASALERKVWLDFGLFKVYPNVFIALVGPPAVSKSSAASFGEELLREIDSIYFAAEIVTKEALRDELIAAAKDAQYGGLKPFTHCSVTLASSELTTLIGYQEPEFLDHLNQLYDCKSFLRERTRKHGSKKIPNICGNLIAATTPVHLLRCLPATAQGTGFASRIITAYENKAPIISFPEQTREQRKLRIALVEDLRRIHTLVGPFGIADDYRDLFRVWYENRPAIDNRFAEYFDRKYKLHVRKLSMLNNVARSSNLKLEAVDFQSALTFLNRIEKGLPEVYGGVGMSKDAPLMDKILKTVERVGKITYTKLLAQMCFDGTRRQIAECLDTLIRANLLDKIVDKSNNIIITTKGGGTNGVRRDKEANNLVS